MNSNINLDNHSIAIAHKDHDVLGGGEVLAERLGLTFDAPVYSGFVNYDNRPELRADVRDLFGGGLRGKMVRRGGFTRQLVYRFAYKRPNQLHDYDVIIQSGMEPLWYVPRDIQTTIAYVHSTPRMQWDLYPYLHDEPNTWLEAIGAWIAELYNDRVRSDFQPPTNYPDMWIANSDLVARRIERYFGVDCDDIRVVYPPVPTDVLNPDGTTETESGEYYLSVNRLDDWKRVDEIIDAFAGRDEQLKIAGRGPAGDSLREQAAGEENIEFLGFVSDAEKRRLYAHAKALVYNALNEDFGMVPIEAIASGTPVISVRDGFQRYQLTDGKNAVMYDRNIKNRDSTVRNLAAAIDRFEAGGVDATKAELVAWAEQFSVERFEREMRECVREAIESTSIETDINSVGDSGYISDLVSNSREVANVGSD